MPVEIQRGCAAYVLFWPNATYVGCSDEVRHRLVRHRYRARKGLKRKELYDQDWSYVEVLIQYAKNIQQADYFETELCRQFAYRNLLNTQKRWVEATCLKTGRQFLFAGSKLAGKQLGINDSLIVAALKGRRNIKQCGGYKWKYL